MDNTIFDNLPKYGDTIGQPNPIVYLRLYSRRDKITYFIMEASQSYGTRPKQDYNDRILFGIKIISHTKPDIDTISWASEIDNKGILTKRFKPQGIKECLQKYVSWDGQKLEQNVIDFYSKMIETRSKNGY